METGKRKLWIIYSKMYIIQRCIIRKVGEQRAEGLKVSLRSIFAWLRVERNRVGRKRTLIVMQY